MKIILLYITIFVSCISGQTVDNLFNKDSKTYFSDEEQAEGMINIYFIQFTNDGKIYFYSYLTTYNAYPDSVVKNYNFFKNRYKIDEFSFNIHPLKDFKIESSKFEIETNTINYRYLNDDEKIEFTSFGMFYKIFGEIYSSEILKVNFIEQHSDFELDNDYTFKLLK